MAMVRTSTIMMRGRVLDMEALRCGSCGIGFVMDMDFNINMNTVLYKLSFQPPS
ncbi:hypothetical protein Goarm_001865, partial [Gossypium armourianum]|nr:hypothetical protein [Gossypium armourianum]